MDDYSPYISHFPKKPFPGRARVDVKLAEYMSIITYGTLINKINENSRT